MNEEHSINVKFRKGQITEKISIQAPKEWIAIPPVAIQHEKLVRSIASITE